LSSQELLRRTASALLHAAAPALDVRIMQHFAGQSNKPCYPLHAANNGRHSRQATTPGQLLGDASAALRRRKL